MSVFRLNKNSFSLNIDSRLKKQDIFSQRKTGLSFNPFADRRSKFYPFVKINFIQKILKHLIFWSVVFLILLYLLLYIKPFEESLIRDIVNLAGFIVLFYTSRFFVYIFYEQKKYKKWIVFSLLSTSLLVVIRTFTEIYIIGTTLFSDTPFTKLSLKLQFGQFVFYFILGHIFFLLFTFYNISKIRSTLEHRLAKFKLQHTELQLKMLNAQLDPHFLFNTLNSIYAISILDSKKTPNLILKLSEILRFITQNSQLKRIQLLLEIEQTQNFLELFKLRNDTPVNIFMDVADDLSDIRIMPMTLLSLVENAMKYGNLMSEKKECFIEIFVKRNNDEIHMIVINTYDKSIINTKSTGLGNKILRQRLEFEYPNRHRFVTTEENKCFKADLKITV